MRYECGVTLIELLVVFLIIGVLAGIVMPLYQDFVARTQVNRLYGEVSALRTAIEDELNLGRDPASVDATADNAMAELGWTDSNLVQGLPVITVNAGAVTLTAILGGEAMTAINGASLTVERTAEGRWLCKVDVAAASGFKNRFLPDNCSVL